MSFLSKQISSTLLIVHAVISSVGTVFMTTSLVSFYYRSNKLKSLILKLNVIEDKFPPLFQQQERDWYKVLIILITILGILLIPDFKMRNVFVVYYLIPVGVAYQNHVFLETILERIRCHFRSINQHLEKQIHAVDLYEIFPFSKDSKIQQLKEKEKFSNLCQIHELSHLHYDLVQLAIDISKVFDVITIASMVLWFGYVIDMIYISIRSMLELKSFRLIVLCSQMLNISFFFVWLLIVVRMYTRTEKEVSKRGIFLYFSLYRLPGEFGNTKRPSNMEQVLLERRYR